MRIPVHGGIFLSPRGRRQKQLVSQDLACLSRSTRYCYTGSVTQSLPVRPDSSSSGPIRCCTEPADGPPVDKASPASVNIGAIVSCASSRLANSTMCSGGGSVPDVSSVRSLLNTAWPCLILDKMCVVAVHATHRPQRIYEIQVSVSSGHTAYSPHDMLVLVLSPSSMLRLLRSEQWIIKSEAVVVKWIRSALLSGGFGKTAKIQYDSEGGCPACGAQRGRHPTRSHEDMPLEDADLLTLLPALVDHSQSTKEFGSAYNILSHLDGLSLSSLPRCLSIPERKSVDFQVGRLICRLSLLHSPSGKFGPAVSVLCPTAVAQGRTGGSMEKPGGMDSWSLAFHAVLEGILRDAEDMAVTIPYQTIRRQFRKLGHYLDGVTIPRLVILDAAHDSNIMAERKVPGHEARIRTTKTLQDLLEDSDDTDLDDAECRHQSRDSSSPSIHVTGLRDWSNCMFADPLMAIVFSDKPSRDFLRGFSGRPSRRKELDIDGKDEGGGFGSRSAYGDIIECPEEAHIRLLLYQCYHATVAVVKEFYRPRSDSTIREFAARKKLNAVLAGLEDVERGPKRGHVRPNGEMSPAKKPKTADGEEDTYC